MEVTITLTEEQVAKIDMLLNTSQSFNFDDEVAKCLRYGGDPARRKAGAEHRAWMTRR